MEIWDLVQELNSVQAEAHKAVDDLNRALGRMESVYRSIGVLQKAIGDKLNRSV